ncbi:hypothetical protein mRhiFer1_009938 [Rhinolophus ferrumequinum]|uniref:Uncharacterized protein n=1 Tax=Rhinolophus ferrumequinum TaxID=59479 RepID=A0A7J7YJP9_RHIFE|nr:hypothetical protein mRhiFer1_009938 [Rhinolophus ferrumequinum]
MISRVSATSSDPVQPQQREGRPLKSYAGGAGSYCHRRGLWEAGKAGDQSPGTEERSPRRLGGGKVKTPRSPAAASRALPPASLWRLGSSRSLARPGSRGKRQSDADWRSGMQVPGGRGRRGDARRKRQRMSQMG